MDGVESMSDRHYSTELAYDMSSTKHPRYHSTHADIWDAREGK